MQKDGSPDADKLFVYARYLQKQSGPKDFADIMRYYRIAAAQRPIAKKSALPVDQ